MQTVLGFNARHIAHGSTVASTGAYTAEDGGLTPTWCNVFGSLAGVASSTAIVVTAQASRDNTNWYRIQFEDPDTPGWAWSKKYTSNPTGVALFVPVMAPALRVQVYNSHATGSCLATLALALT